MHPQLKRIFISALSSTSFPQRFLTLQNSQYPFEADVSGTKIVVFLIYISFFFSFHLTSIVLKQ